MAVMGSIFYRRVFNFFIRLENDVTNPEIKVKVRHTQNNER